MNSLLLTIDDLRNDSSNPSCLSNRTGWKFGHSNQSSLIILSRSLQSNQTYQFMVEMSNRQNASQHATGYVLVKVEDTRPIMIAIGCVINTLCAPNSEYQFVNPTTQIALFSIPIGNYSRIENIIWNLYSGEINSTANYSQWILFNQIQFENIWFFGRNSSNFTATKQLFLNYPSIQFWKFEVVYSFSSETSVSSLNFIINQSPQNGCCSISPSNGTIATLFTISCSNWSDEDGIKDYSIYSQKSMIAFSSLPSIEVRLPFGDNQVLLVEIRDELNCVTQYNLSSISVQTDSQTMSNLLTSPNNSIVNLLSTGHQNTIGQLLTSVSQEFNRMSTENINRATSNGIPIASISVSSLTNQCQSTNISFNQSALVEFNKDLNSQANTLEYIISLTQNLPITTTSNSIILQSSSLAQLTKSTNHLTRTSISIAADKCYQLTLALHSMSMKMTQEDAQIAAKQLIQCASNVLTAVNSPLQERTIVLDSDALQASGSFDDYEIELESEWLKVDKNTYYQQKIADQVANQMNELVSRLTSTLNIHINVGQQLVINTSEVFMSLESQTMQSLSNKQFIDGLIRFPSITTNQNNSKIFIRVCFHIYLFIRNNYF